MKCMLINARVAYRDNEKGTRERSCVCVLGGGGGGGGGPLFAMKGEVIGYIRRSRPLGVI